MDRQLVVKALETELKTIEKDLDFMLARPATDDFGYHGSVLGRAKAYVRNINDNIERCEKILFEIKLFRSGDPVEDL